MNLESFSKHDDGFTLQNFRAEFRWKTAASISFMLCHHPAPSVTKGFGWLDVHETNDEWRRIKIRICFHHDFVRFENCQNVVREICDCLSLPNDSYEATFISPLKQISFDTGCDHEFVAYEPPYEAGDNPWDDRDGVAPLEIISRETAFGMLLAIFPDFHHRVDGIERSGIMKNLGEPFRDFRETFALVDAVEFAIKTHDKPQLRRPFELVEELVAFGDDYTRNASLTRMFELLQQRDLIGRSLVPFMLPRTLDKSSRTVEEMAETGKQSDAREWRRYALASCCHRTDERTS